MNKYLLESIKKNAGLINQETLVRELVEDVVIEEEYLSESELEYLAEGLVFFKKSKRLMRLADVLEKKNEKKDLGGTKRIIRLTRKVALMYQETERKNKSKDKVERKEAKAEYKKIGKDFSDILDELKRKEVRSTLKAAGAISVIVAIVLLITSGYLQQLDIFNKGSEGRADFKAHSYGNQLPKVGADADELASEKMDMKDSAKAAKEAKEATLDKEALASKKAGDQNMADFKSVSNAGMEKSYKFQSDFQADITSMKSKFVFDLSSKTDDVKDVISSKTMSSLEAVNTKVKDPIVKRATNVIKYFFHKNQKEA